MATSDISKSPLYIDSTNSRVGVGTASPAQPLHVVGGAVQFQNTQSTYLQVNTSDTHFYTAGAHPLRLGSNSAEVVRVETGGLTFTPATNNLYTVSGTLSYYGTTNNVYLNGASSGGMIMSGNGNRNQYVYLNSVSDSVMITTNTVERLGIDSSGRVTMPYQPLFHVYRNAIATSGSYIAHNATIVNNGGHYNSTNGKFTAPVSGNYMFYATGLTQPTGGTSRMRIVKNGSTYVSGESRHQGGTAGAYLHATIQAVVNMSAGDWVQQYYINDDGSTTLYSDGTPYITFGGHLIG